VGVRQRGSNREMETDKVRKVERVKICFTLAENKVVESGTKNIYIRIAAPDRKILAKGRGDEYSFVVQGERLQYSIMETIDYQNQNQEICVYWDKRDTQELVEGVYAVDIYEGENLIGQVNFTLR
jgi:hypothetical protein